MRRSCWPLVAGLVLGAGCSTKGGRETPEPAAPSSAPVAARPFLGNERVGLLGTLDTCEVRHRGLSLDLGTPAAHQLLDFAVSKPPSVQDVERGGATFARFKQAEARLAVWLDSDRSHDLAISARVFAGTARRMSAFIDGKPLGSARLEEGKLAIVNLPVAPLDIPRGRHTLMLRFSGAPRGAAGFLAEVDWVRLGTRDELEETYAAPTAEDIVADFELDGTPRRSLILRAPGSVRCPLRPSRDAVLKLMLGYWGDGSGVAEIRVLRDGEAAVTLQQRKVVGGSGAQWLPLEIDLAPFAGQLVALELRALESSGGGRVVFGEPILARAREVDALVPQASTVVVVVLASIDRQRVPPWGRIGRFEAVGELARSGVAYSGYRVPATIPAATIASLLTGLAPRSHALEDQAARLPASARTLASVAKAAGVRTAFFTGVPTSFAAFGFDTGWDRFEAYSPVHDVAATEPFDEAARWLEREAKGGQGKRLVVIHARGAHPPWDVPREVAARLPPDEYGGAIEPRRGGIVVGQLRTRPNAAGRRLSPEEWVRLRALEETTLVQQDQALGRLMETLEREGLWSDTLLFLLGDVAVGDPPRLPYDPAGPATEDRLVTPLLVKYPRSALAGSEQSSPATTVDIATTVLRALRIDLPGPLVGHDLFRLAAGLEPLAGRLLVATHGQSFAARTGSWLLTGEPGRVPYLCALDVDPACVTNQFDSRPIVAQALWRWTYLEEQRARDRAQRAAEREPASIDPDLAAALIVWGDVQ